MKKKFDWMNFFYSLGACIILLGVITKLLELPGQDIFMTVGLSVEIFIFALGAFKFEIKKVPETEDTNDEPSLLNHSSSGTYINIQTNSLDNLTAQGNYLVDSDDASTKEKITLELNLNQDVTFDSDNGISKLDQIYTLSQVEDLFYHPSFIVFSATDYISISNLIKSLFNKRMPSFEFLPVLINSPIVIPTPDFNNLKLIESISLDENDLELLLKLFEEIEFDNLTEKFLFEKINSDTLIREKLSNERQVYGGEDSKILDHITKYKSQDYIISPPIRSLKKFIALKDDLLLKDLIENVDISKSFQYFSLYTITKSSNDLCKEYLLNKIGAYRYEPSIKSSFKYFTSIIDIALSITERSIAKSYLMNNIEILLDKNTILKFSKIVPVDNEYIYFGKDNEYIIKVDEILIDNEVKNYKFVLNIINELVKTNVGNEFELFELFDLNKDAKRFIYDNIKSKLIGSNNIATGAQLAFILLYEQYYK